MSRRPDLGSRSRDTCSKAYCRYAATVQARCPDLTRLDSTRSSRCPMARSSRREDHVLA